MCMCLYEGMRVRVCVCVCMCVRAFNEHAHGNFECLYVYVLLYEGIRGACGHINAHTRARMISSMQKYSHIHIHIHIHTYAWQIHSQDIHTQDMHTQDIHTQDINIQHIAGARNICTCQVTRYRGYQVCMHVRLLVHMYVYNGQLSQYGGHRVRTYVCMYVCA